ncbi:MAG: DMT family transporter [Treponemataceae bacterium]|nr:DMT family transporter [Treponemataceae bacterium]
MNKKALRADGLLLLTAAIWGFAFVAQRDGMSYMRPFTFNGVRFALGAFSLFPVIGIYARSTVRAMKKQDWFFLFFTSLGAGILLFLGANLQQIGIVYTTAGKAGFLTGLYVVLVPVAGIFLRHHTGLSTWIGTILAVGGMYILSAPDELGRINPGDLFVIASALFWTGHVLYIDWFSKRCIPLLLAAAQFLWCALFSLIVAFLWEAPHWAALSAGWLPIVYGGIGSVGIAYTLQVIAQKDAHPAHAAIILCLEGAFATLGGILLLGEPFGTRNWAGSTLMFAGMIASQWDLIREKGAAQAGPTA